jgi:hypothetical protein
VPHPTAAACSVVFAGVLPYAPNGKPGCQPRPPDTAGAGLYLSSHYTDARRVSNWTTSVASSPEANDKQQPARSTNSRRRLMAEPSSCDSQTWPNISPECIAGRAEPAKVVERAPLVAEQPSSILLRPTKLPEAVPDPAVTGALPSGEQQLKVRDSEPAVGTVKTSRKPKPDRRELPVMAKAKTPKAELRARAEQRPLRDAGRWNRSTAIIEVADRAAPEPSQRVSEPIQYRLAQGNR